MANLHIYLLGTPRFRQDESPITGFVTKKAQALLIYLFGTGQVQSRDTLAAMFWPESPEANARNSLRRILPNLRRLVGDYLSIERQEIALNRQSSYWVDTAELVKILSTLRTDASRDSVPAEMLESALQLYTDDFLTGFHVPDAPAFEEWMLFQREHLRELALKGFGVLADHYIHHDQIEAGLIATKRLLTLEPWYETGHRRRMLLLARSGDRGAALQQYELCRRMLADEFGLQPAPETSALYEAIKSHGAAIADPSTSPQPLPIRRHPPAPELPGLEDVPREQLFIGRDTELSQLQQWHLAEQSAIVALVGVGGAGKTTLAAHYVQLLDAMPRLDTPVDRVLWSSLLNAPPLVVVLRIWLRALTHRQLVELPDTVDELAALLFGHLRKQRCLLVLDNLESIMGEGENRGSFRPGYEEYEGLLRQMAELRHTSTLLVTSRELPAVLNRLAHTPHPLHTMHLAGLPDAAGAELLRQLGAANQPADLTVLVQRYSGNPLALQLIADTIRELYDGDVHEFLAEGTPIFGDIRHVLDEQMARLQPLEQEILTWLAVARAPVTPKTLWEDLAGSVEKHEFLHAISTLQHSSLVERRAPDPETPTRHLTLQNVVMEYVTSCLLNAYESGLTLGNLDAFQRHPLVKAHAPEHVQASQRRLLLAPVAERALQRWGRVGAEKRLHALLEQLREKPPVSHGYAGANILHLLLQFQADLRGVDFSHVAIRQADLRTAILIDVNFSDADFSQSLFAHTIGAVESIAVSPDGEQLAAAGSDGGIYLWRLADFQLHKVLIHHTQLINTICFSADGRLLVSSGLDGLTYIWEVGSGDLTGPPLDNGRPIITMDLQSSGSLLATGDTSEQIHLWDWEKGQAMQTLSSSAGITQLALSPDGRTLVSVGEERQINVWEPASGRLRRTLREHAGKILTVAFSPDGHRFATGGEDGQICIWDTASLLREQCINAHDDFVLSLAFCNQGTHIASTGADQTVRIHQVATGELQQVLLGHRGWVKTVAWSADDRRVITGGYDQTIRVWEVQNNRLQRILQGHLRWINFINFSHNGRLLAAASLDGTVRVWDVQSGALLRLLHGHRAATRNVVFRHDDSLLATAGDDHLIHIWALPSGLLRHTLRGHGGSVRNLEFSPDGRLLASGSHDGTIRIWDVDSGRCHRRIDGACAGIQFATAFHPTGRTLAYGATDGTIRLVDPDRGDPVCTLSIGATTPAVLAWNTHGDVLACGTREGAVFIHRLPADHATGARPQTTRIHATDAPVWRLLISPDGSRLAWSCTAQEIRTYAMESGQLSEAMRTRYGAFCLGFSRTGEQIITDGPDNTVLVRAAATGAVQRTLTGQQAAMTSIAVSPATGMVAGSSTDGALHLWDPESGVRLAELTLPGPYAGMQITGAQGLTAAQQRALLALGAVADDG